MDQEFIPPNVKFETQTTVFCQQVKVEKVNVSFKLDAKTWTPAVAHQFIDAPPKVSVLPYDPYENKVICVEHFQIGTLKQKEGPWQLELPTHPISPGMSQISAVETALNKEISCEGLDTEFIGDFYTSPSLSNEKVFVYCAGIDSNEIRSQARIEILTLEEAKEGIYGNYFHDVGTIMALHWLFSNQIRLQKKWQ